MVGALQPDHAAVADRVDFDHGAVRVGAEEGHHERAQREVLELAYFQGLTCVEIADRTGAPVGTVKSRLAGGLKKLRQALRSGDAR